MVLFKRPWEHWTRRSRQKALAGTMPRDEYLESRKQAADDLLRLLEINDSSVGFEIGSGEGIVARDLAPRCRHLDCCDISRTFLKLARSNCRALPNVRCHLIKKDFLNFLPAVHYDFGYSLNVFIHLNQYEIHHYFLSIRRLLKPRGCFFFTGATLGPETIEMFRFFSRRYLKLGESRPGFMRWANLEILDAIAQEAGLRIDPQRTSQAGGHLRVTIRR